MTRKDKGRYAAKHPVDREPDSKLVKAIQDRTVKGVVPCAVAFVAADELKVPPGEIGFIIDRLEIPITECQLGLFGFSPVKRIIRKAETVSEELEDAIRQAMVDGRLSCKASWEIAKKFKMAKIRVSSACEALGIKLSSCQLGAF
jgi:hypothetical protein